MIIIDEDEDEWWWIDEWIIKIINEWKNKLIWKSNWKRIEINWIRKRRVRIKVNDRKIRLGERNNKRLSQLGRKC